MFVCRECGSLFEDPASYYEAHGFSDCRGEEWSVCPCCGSPDYDVGVFCHSCGEFIPSEDAIPIHIPHTVYICEDCAIQGGYYD